MIITKTYISTFNKCIFTDEITEKILPTCGQYTTYTFHLVYGTNAYFKQ